jgi:hypothetical protein
MTVLLVVERETSEGRISAMVWEAMAGDPALIERKAFHGESAFKVWLAGIATRYGASHITVDWNTLDSDARLTAAVREVVPPA